MLKLLAVYRIVKLNAISLQGDLIMPRVSHFIDRTDVPRLVRGIQKSFYIVGSRGQAAGRRVRNNMCRSLKVRNSCIHRIIFLFIVFLTGCMPSPEAVQSPQAIAEEIKSTKKLSSWELQGLIGARHAQKAWSAHLIWTQQGSDQYHLRLLGPLGGGTILINKKGSQVTYQDGKKTISAARASTLLKQQTGIELPVESLYYWVRGIPAPGAVHSSRYDNLHQLVSLSQFGYNINYTHYQTINTYRLPTKIRLEGRGLLVKLIIKQWKIN